MLELTIPAIELWDEISEEYINCNALTLQLEHSLVSISKWESKWCKAFLSKHDKTAEETLDYIRCMTLTKNVKSEIYHALTADNIMKINEYIGAPMTATVFYSDDKTENNREVITSELIYYWMLSQKIPVEFQKWHINRLLTLIRLCNVKNAPPKKMGMKEIMSRNARLNATRKQQLNTKG